MPNPAREPPSRRRRALRIALSLSVALVGAGCATSGGAPRWSRVHVVAQGDTVWDLAQRYGTTIEAISRVNQLRDPSRIRVGARLRVPERPTRRAARPGALAQTARPLAVAAGSGIGRAGPAAPLRWPVRGDLTSGFGPRNGSQHDGIDIRAPAGTPVAAAADGLVVHSSRGVPGYGNLIILKHAGGRSTVYAHNRTLAVQVGDRVRAGQVIAEVGATGRATGPHLHFEVRQDGRATDPLEWLP